MTTIKAVGLHKYLDIEHPESFIDVEMEKPVPVSKDLLVHVKAVSVNTVDAKVRARKDKVEASLRVLGWDVAGVVEQAGPECTLFQAGDEVYYAGSLIRPGGNSEFHLVNERIVGRKPISLDFAQSAAMPLTTLTAWEAMFERMGVSLDQDVNSGKNILIIGVAGGVGSITVQLAKYAGLTVIGTASRSESSEWAKELGADYIINHYEKFVPQLNAIELQHVDYIFCLNSTEKHWENMAEAVAPQGKICSIVGTGQSLNLTLLMNKSVTFAWELMFTRSIFQTEDMIEQHRILNAAADLLDSGVLRTTITERLEPINAANLRKAHSKIESGRTIGKIVLEGFN
jgi:NADPH2:quinone reductase